MVICDNSFTLYINGQKAGSGGNPDGNLVEVGPYLKIGQNLVACRMLPKPRLARRIRQIVNGMNGHGFWPIFKYGPTSTRLPLSSRCRRRLFGR